MKKLILTISLLLLSGFCLIYSQEKNGNELFDFGWRFHLGGAQRAEQPEFDDSGWRKIDLPHDWSIEDRPGTSSPFDVNAISQANGGFTTGGTGWYRKIFTIPAGQKGKIFTLLFEGVYMNAEVWLNGESLGSHPYGYTSFFFDITSKLKYGKENTLAVKVINEGENSRWYSGSGIYRHVWLTISTPVHISTWGTFITTPVVTNETAKVDVQTSIVNKSGEIAEAKLITTFLNIDGKETGKIESNQSIASGKTISVSQTGEIKKPILWSVELPNLYKAVSEIYINNQLADRKETHFGIRTISFDTNNGFRLNGKTLKLKGGCVHHDNGPLGSKAYDRAEERRIELLKASGYNAIRSSHNPPSPAFLDACDKLGMLVIDEAFDMWKEAKNPFDFHLYFNEWWQKDIESMVIRDRNHPSVIMWSIGNEIPNRHSPEVVKVAKMLVDYIKTLDTTRQVTSAVNDLKPDKDPYFATLDISGYNYAAGGDHNQKSLYAADHQRVPDRVMYGSESYPLEAFSSWMDVVDYPYVIGDFVWTAFDYIGEASIGWRGYWQEQSFFPWNLAFCGDIDICGWKRPQSYYRDALWMPNQISVFVKPPQPSFPENPNRQSWSKWHWLDAVSNWNWAGNENKGLEVSVYSSCEQVELFLNGKSLGKKPTNRETKFLAIWQVPYQAGILKAIGYTGKKQVKVSELKTAAQASHISMKADRPQIKADGQDLSYITVELTDDKGIRNPEAENLIHFEIDGPGTIVGIGNANPVSIESNQLPRRKAWQGKCLIIIKSGSATGKISLKASGEGLKTSITEISTIQN